MTINNLSTFIILYSLLVVVNQHYLQNLTSSPQVQIKCMQTFRSILGHSAANVSAGFIHALAPKVLQYLHSEKARQVTTDADLTLVVESLGVVEALVRLAEPQHRTYGTAANHNSPQ